MNTRKRMMMQSKAAEEYQSIYPGLIFEWDNEWLNNGSYTKGVITNGICTVWIKLGSRSNHTFKVTSTRSYDGWDYPKGYTSKYIENKTLHFYSYAIGTNVGGVLFKDVYNRVVVLAGFIYFVFTYNGEKPIGQIIDVTTNEVIFKDGEILVDDVAFEKTRLIPRNSGGYWIIPAYEV